MDTRSGANDTRLAHQKRLHFILFVDAAKTRSFSLKIKHAWWLFASLVVFFIASIATSVILFKTFRKLKSTQHYLVDVKRELFTQSVTLGNILSPEFIGGGYNAETPKVYVPVSKPVVVGEKKQPPLEKIAVAPTSGLAPAPVSSLAKTAASAASVPNSSPVRFENIALADDDDDHGTINISFDLQNVSGRILTGWVCAAITFKTAEGTLSVRAAPSSVSLGNHQGHSIPSCKGGELVKFSRLRPTILSTSGSKLNAERVTVYFTDSVSGHQFAHKSE